MRLLNILQRVGISFILLVPATLLHSQQNPFISFEVRPGAGCTIFLQWEVIAQMDTLSFEVERSRDKEKWEKLAEDHVRPSHKYSAFDVQPQDSLNYYRIKQVGSQGIFVYSDIKWIQIDAYRDVFLWPNPADEGLFVRTPFLDGSMVIFDSSGKLIRELVVTNFITYVYTGNFSKGIYFLHIKNNKQLLIEKFVKQ